MESKPRREIGFGDAVCILPSLVICPVTLGKYLNLAMLPLSHLENKKSHLPMLRLNEVMEVNVFSQYLASGFLLVYRVFA